MGGAVEERAWLKCCVTSDSSFSLDLCPFMRKERVNLICGSYMRLVIRIHLYIHLPIHSFIHSFIQQIFIGQKVTLCQAPYPWGFSGEKRD